MDKFDWPVWEEQFMRFVQSQTPSDDPAHDLAHIERVVANARRLAAAEAAQLAVVLPAAWLHDCVVVPKNSPERSQASRRAAQAAGVFLQSRAFPATHIPAIQHAIEAHSFSAGIAPRTVEAMVVQDADRLDSLGAVGVARCLMLGAAMGKPLYDQHEPLPVTRPPDDTANIIDHFFTKLLKLADGMHTAAGKQEAQRRTRFLQQFLTQLQSEIT